MKIILNKTFAEIKEEISTARQDAREEAQSVCSCVRSRGAYLKARDKHGELLTESESIEFTTKKRLISDIEDLKKSGAVEFYIEGGFDGADSLWDLNNFEYEPWVSEWYVDIEVEE